MKVSSVCRDQLEKLLEHSGPLEYFNFCLAVIYGIGEIHCPVLECALKIPGQEFFQAVAGNSPCSEGGNILENTLPSDVL